jgi:solute carrier family 25 carnitine/acylcarnitine transporter 20/29
MGAPLGAAAVINAIVFSSYGFSSRWYDQYYAAEQQQQQQQQSGSSSETTPVYHPEEYGGFDDFDDDGPVHDPWQKAMSCGSFAGLVQCTVICPMEHVKCRLQTQHGAGAADHKFKGPVQAVRHIVSEHGFARLYQGWWSSCWREVPAFGLVRLQKRKDGFSPNESSHVIFTRSDLPLPVHSILPPTIT